MKTWIVLLAVVLLVGCARTKTQRRSALPPPPLPPQPILERLVERQALEQPPAPEIEDPSALLVLPRRSAQGVDDFHRKEGGKVMRYKNTRWEAIEFPGNSAQQKIVPYKTSKLFEEVKLDRVYKAQEVPNDALYQQLWNMAKIDAPGGWNKSTTNDVVIAVIDTGVDYNHPDLARNLWIGPNNEHGFTCTNGIIKPGGMDVNGHGSHVAGILGAVGNNGIGVVGINWSTKIMSLQFLDEMGFGSARHAALLIDRMITLKQSGVNIRVANNSWGTFGQDPFLQSLFEAAGKAGILMVCCAGNHDADTDQFSFVPATFPGDYIMSILASDQNDKKASFSNYGLVTTDVLAPGVDILSTKTNGTYQLNSGTSMATPHIAGAAAMLFQLNPQLTPAQVKGILLQSASLDQTPFTTNVTHGGRLNLNKLFHNPAIIDKPPPFLAIADNPLRLTVMSQAGSMVEVEYSTNMVTWQRFAAVTNTIGTVSFPIMSQPSGQVFRALEP